MLLDGKHTVIAIMKITEMYKNECEEVSDPADVGEGTLRFTPALLKAINEGLEVDVVEFGDDDEDLRVAYCCQSHDEVTNKFKVTSMKDLVGVANRYKNKAIGGTWEAVKVRLVEIYGLRTSYIHRILVAAQTLPPSVLDLLDRLGVPNSYINENPYYVGHGKDNAKRLSDDWRLAVAGCYGEEASKGIGFSKESFLSELCVPAKHAENWVKARRREFGALAESPAFRRVEEFLQSSQSRPQLLKCIRLGIPLQGSGPQAQGDNLGIDQCRIVYQSLKEALGRSSGILPSSAAATGDTAPPTESGAVPSEEAGAQGMLTGMETEDSALAAAKTKTEAAFGCISFYPTFAELSAYLTRILVPTEKLIFLIDFMTSKARVPLNQLEMIGAFLKVHGHTTPQKPGVSPAKCRIFVLTGARHDLVSAIEAKLAVCTPTLSRFFVTLTAGATHGRKKPFFMVMACDQASAPSLNVPHVIEALTVRARPGEGTRLRCLDENCGLRSAEERQELELSSARDNPKAELNVEHTEVAIDDQIQEEEDAGQKIEVVGVKGVTERTCIRDLWPYGMPREFYKTLLSKIVGSEAGAHFVYLSSTAHPGALAAGRFLKMQVHCVLSDTKHHSVAHGQKLLRDSIFQEILETERANTQHVKRVLEADVRYVNLVAPSTQSVRFDTVACDKNWRSGNDTCPSADFLETSLPRLFASELDRFGFQSLAHALLPAGRDTGFQRKARFSKKTGALVLRSGFAVKPKSSGSLLSSVLWVTMRAFVGLAGLCIVQDGKNKTIATIAGRPDESLLGEVTCLFFSSPSAVLEFLNISGNAALLDGPIFCISGMLTDANENTSIYAIPTGVGRLLTDYRATARGVPNAQILVHPEAGLNDGLLSFKIRTHNFQGVSARSTLTCDFGQGWSLADSAPYLAQSPAKKLRGALDACFLEQAKKDEVKKEVAQATKDDEPKEPAEKKPKKEDGKKEEAKKEEDAKATKEVASKESVTAAGASVAAPSAGAAASSAPVVGKFDDWEVTISGAKLRVCNMKGNSRKLVPKTVLAVWRAGKLEEAAGAVKQFSVAKSSEMIVHIDAGGKNAVSSLATYVQTNGLEGVYQHGKWPKGNVPDKLVVKKAIGYVPSAAELALVPAAVTAATAATSVKIMWVVTTAESKVIPVGVALVTTKQLVVPGIGCERSWSGGGGLQKVQCWTGMPASACLVTAGRVWSPARRLNPDRSQGKGVADL